MRDVLERGSVLPAPDYPDEASGAGSRRGAGRVQALPGVQRRRGTGVPIRLSRYAIKLPDRQYAERP